MNVEILKKKAERARVKFGLTDDQLALIQGCAHQVYEEVSYDLEPDVKRQRACRRSTIIEVVTDANRLEDIVRKQAKLPPHPRNVKEKDSAEDHPLVRACRNFDLIDDLIGPAFPYALYEAGPYEDELNK